MHLDELLSSIEVIGIPTRTNFRGVALREIVLIHRGGRWGEFAPFSDYSIERDALWLACAIESIEQPFPTAIRDAVAVNATLPEVPINQVAEVLSWFPGCKTVKVKVGTADDEERITEVFQNIPDAKLRLDANGLFSIQEAESFLVGLYNKYGHQLEYVEQPCASLAENGALKLPIPIAIDENLRLGDDIAEINKVADVAIIKVAPLGGIKRALEVIESLDVPVVISSALESSVGMAASVALAAHLPEEIICGLGTVALLDGDIASNSLTPRAGKVPVQPVVVNESSLTRYRLSSERVSWWHNRIKVAYGKYLQNMERGAAR